MGEKLSFPPFFLLNLTPTPLRLSGSDKSEHGLIRSKNVFIWVWIVWWVYLLVPAWFHWFWHNCWLNLVVPWFHGFFSPGSLVPGCLEFPWELEQTPPIFLVFVMFSYSQDVGGPPQLCLPPFPVGLDKSSILFFLLTLFSLTSRHIFWRCPICLQILHLKAVFS